MANRDANHAGHRQRREAGAAMLVVMLLLIVGTTLASMTVHSITMEMRSSGYYRQQAQTHYVAEAAMLGVLGIPPGIIKARMDPTFTTVVADEGFPFDITDPTLMQNYGEPNPARVGPGGMPVLRLPQHVVESSLTGVAGGGVPVIDGQSLGPSAFMPWYVVDFTDFRYEDNPVAGQDASGNATMVFVNATVTVRGRTLLAAAGAVSAVRGASSTVAGDQFQQFTDAAYDMRAVVRLGPVPK